MQTYSQTRALLAIVKANIIASFRSPYSVLLGILVPLIFIVVFSITSSSLVSIDIVQTPDCDTTNSIYEELSKIHQVKLKKYNEVKEISLALQQHKIVAVMRIKKQDNGHYLIELNAYSSNTENFNLFQIILNNIIYRINQKTFSENQTIATISSLIIPSKAYSSIDFILPGQLGLSLLAVGVMGVAFSMFQLRKSLVLKRFRATPIRKINILLGEAIGRVIFQLLTASIVILVGKVFFNFTLANGIISYIEMIVLCFIGLLIFMGIGLIISGIARNDHIIPIWGNIVMFPQIILSGTFFSIDVFPQWIRIIAYFIPLTPLNNMLRKIAFDGMHIWELLPQCGVLLIWAIAVYTVAAKNFKWE